MFKGGTKIIISIFILFLVFIVGGKQVFAAAVASPAEVSAAIAGCKAAVAAAPLPDVCTANGGLILTSNSFTCTGGVQATQIAIAAQTAALNKCVADAEKMNAKLITTSDWTAFVKDWGNQLWWQSVKTGFAAALKTSLSIFAKQFAYDTATWVASGGKGQQPLFITEGWDKYLSNAVDTTVGDFIARGWKNGFGTDICEPNLAVKLAITIGIDWTAPQKPMCSLSSMIGNWQQQINNPNFSVDYRASMRPGANDISSFLMVQSALFDKVNWDLKVKAQEASPDGFKAVKDFAGKILTPSSMVKDSELLSRTQANAGHEIFTNTLWDFVDTFVQTLVGTLFKNLTTGFFSDSGIGNSSKSGSDNGSGDVYDANASPSSEGIAGAQSRYLNIINNKEYTTGQTWDILSKLAVCTDQSRSNPGPTDCVMDDMLAQAIREKKLTMDLPAGILDRPFAPKIEQVSDPQTVFTLRNVTIMRKYRIVPVGWEIAAKYISQYGDKGYTLRSIMADFDNSASPFFKLVDPFWVVKAPELFCRRQGYGADLTNAADGTVNRDQYCTDEQQCIKEDDNGKCLAFGYCTEEKRVWDFNGTTCQPRFNTCQTFTNTQGTAASYLANTLDYRNCNAQNAGCKWYSTDFNPISNYFGDGATSSEYFYNLNKCNSTAGCLVSGVGVSSFRVPLWHSVSSDGRVVMAVPCDTSNPLYKKNTGDGYCDYTKASCTIPQGGVKCKVDKCTGGIDIVANLNPNFATCTGWEAKFWSLGYELPNKKHSCVDGGRTNNALQAYSIGDNNAIVSSLPLPSTIESNSRYTVKFYAKGNLTRGGIAVDIFSGSVLGGLTVNADNVSSDWREYEFEFDVQNAGTASLRVTTIEGTVGTVYFDDFEVKKVDQNCASGLVWLTLGPATQKAATTIFFDKDVQACQSDKEGCAQFIRTRAGLDSNLIPNSDFELAPADTIVSGWREEEHNGVRLYEHNGTFSKSTEPVHGGQNSIRLTNNDLLQASHGTYTVTTINSITLVAGKRYILSGWIYYPTGSTGSALINAMNYKDVLTRSNLYATSTLNEWQRVEKVIDLTSVTTDLEVWPRLIREAYGSGEIPTGDVWFDDIKLEEVPYDSETASDYTPYDPSKRPDNQLAYLKRAPGYYNCYLTSAGTWPISKPQLLDVLSGRNPVCANFAGVCTPEEVGCDRYKPTNNDPSIPATVNSGDLCPGECVGYKVYLQEQTNFVASQYQKFIANDTPKYCSASYAGCDEFTNLDALAKGGESLAYYSAIRSCQKPQDDPDGTDFYTWEGSDTTGYQLKSYRLKNTQSTNLYPQSPCTNLTYHQTGDQKSKNYCNDIVDLTDVNNRNATLGGLLTSAMAAEGVGDIKSYLEKINTNPAVVTTSVVLSQTIVNELHKYGLCVRAELQGYYYFNADKNDLVSIDQNPDCREFYSISGDVTYRLLSKTTSISEDCHPYRRTKTQANTSAVCVALEGAVVPVAQCDCASTGGYFNDYGECVYMAVPSDGTTCPAEFAKCREYTGNRGANVRNIFLDDFENGASGWSNGTLSSEANFPGGKSLLSDAILKKNVFVKSGKSYTLSFWAKGGTSFELKNIKFADAESKNYFAVSMADGGLLPVSQVAVNGNWQRYELGPVLMDWSDDGYKELQINTGHNQLYIDNILLKQVTDNLFLVENSWFTPQKCDNKLSDPDGRSCGGSPADPKRCVDGEMVGCSTYSNALGESIDLKSFNQLCRPEAVGCEALIDTKNSDSPFAEQLNAGDKIYDDVNIPSDAPVYLVNTAKSVCDVSDQGCTRYGLPKVNNRDEVTDYQNVYLKNQPARYTTDLCKFNELWCDAFDLGRTQTYFKDPRDKICANRYEKTATTTISGWFKKGSDESCLTTPYQTMGTGSKIEKIQPVGWFDNVTQTATIGYTGFAGSCSTSQSGCSEYIDPLARMYSEELYNNDFSQNVDNDVNADGWKTKCSLLTQPCCWKNSCKPKNDIIIRATTTVNLMADNLYTLTITGNGHLEAVVSCGSTNKLWSPDNSMAPDARTHDIKMIRDNTGSVIISGRFYINKNAASCQVEVRGDLGFTKVQLVPTGVYYNLDQSIDRTSCNGLVDFKTGCVLFNSRGSISYGSNNYTARVRDDYLNFDVDATDLKQANGKISPVVPEKKDQRNVNDIIKVSPNRQCNQWLYCNTYEKGDVNNPSPLFGGADKCLSLSSCSSVDENGDCNRFVYTAGPTEQKYSLSRVNYTGYTVVGKDFSDGKKIPGYYPFQTMPQVGESVTVPNGNFESVYGEQQEPIGWYDTATSTTDIGWRSYKFSIESAPTTRKEGVGYLRLNSSYRAESDIIDIEKDSDYVLNAWVNTNDLHPTSSVARVIVYGLNTVVSPSRWDEISAFNNVSAAGLPWQQVQVQVTSAQLFYGQGVYYKRIKIGLANWLDTDHNGKCDDKNNDQICDVTGQSYFDDIQLKPVLKVKNSGQLISRTCRAYPARDARSCAYISGNNLFYGQTGYCLTKDPQNSSLCLQWWPIEQPKGETQDEIGYTERVPLYYCIEPTRVPLTPLPIVDVPRTEFKEGSTIRPKVNLSGREIQLAGEYKIIDIKCTWDTYTNNNLHHSGVLTLDWKNNFEVAWEDESDKDINNGNGYPVIPASRALAAMDDSNACEKVGNDPDGDGIKNLDVDGPRVLYAKTDVDADGFMTGFTVAACNSSGAGDHYEMLCQAHLVSGHCGTVVKAVTITGSNKNWYTRLQKGSEYVVPPPALYFSGLIDFIHNSSTASSTYITDSSPYGSIVPPEPVIDPRLWDARSDPGNQPLFWEESSKNMPRMGNTHDVTSLKNIFVRYYGLWAWTPASGNCNFNVHPAVCSDDSFAKGSPCTSDSQCHRDAWYQDVFTALSTEDRFKQWDIPSQSCKSPSGVPLKTRPAMVSLMQNPYCYIPPVIPPNEVKINDTPIITTINGSGVVKLSFNVVTDPDQLPLTFYKVAWGENVDTTVSGVNLRSRTNPTNKFELYHYYDYWQVKSRNKYPNPGGGIICYGDGNEVNGLDIEQDSCLIRAFITVRDNWNKEATVYSKWIEVKQN